MPGTGPLPGAELAVSELEEHSLLLENGTQKVLELGAKSKVGVKHAAVTTWLSVSPNGTAALLELGKLKVTHQLGVQLRDLRSAGCAGVRRHTRAEGWDACPWPRRDRTPWE